MGLDGISINQLRSAQESNSAELNNISRFAPDKNSKAIDGLSQGRVIDPDDEKENNNSGFEHARDTDEDDSSEDSQEIETTIKYDLSNSDKYSIRLDESNDVITIVETKTNKVIQVLDSNQLSRFVTFLADAKGSMINRKY